MPMLTGTRIITTRVRMVRSTGSSSTRSLSRKWPSAQLVNIGSVTTVTRLAATVSTMDSATSPRPRKANRLEVVPPGQAAMITNPTASAGERSSVIARPTPTSGSSTICATRP